LLPALLDTDASTDDLFSSASYAIMALLRGEISISYWGLGRLPKGKEIVGKLLSTSSDNNLFRVMSSFLLE
jgi:hypothetical protein